MLPGRPGVRRARPHASAAALCRGVRRTADRPRRPGLAPRPVIGPDVQLSADGWKTVMRAAAPGVLAGVAAGRSAAGLPRCSYMVRALENTENQEKSFLEISRKKRNSKYLKI